MAVSRDELERINQHLFSSHILCAAVAKMYLASPDPSRIYNSQPGSFLRRFPNISSATWTDSGIYGAVLLVYDPSDFTLSFQVWNLQKMKCVFTYEIYVNFKYMKLTSNFYCFEIDDCVLGFAFSNASEAVKFNDKVQEALRRGNLAATDSYSQSQSQILNDGKSFVSLTMSHPETESYYQQTISSQKSKESSKNSKASRGKGKKTKQEMLTEQVNNMSGGMLSIGTNVKMYNSSGKKKGEPRTKLTRQSKKRGNQPAPVMKRAISNPRYSKTRKPTATSTTESNPVIMRSRTKGSFVSMVGSQVEIAQNKSKSNSNPVLDREKSGSSSNSNKKNPVLMSPKLSKISRVKPLAYQPPSEKRLSVNPDGTFDLANMPTHWKQTFKEAGITKRDLQNPGTASMILDTLQHQEMLVTYLEQPEYQNLPEDELENLAEMNKDQYQKYLDDVEQYEYEAEQFDKYNKQLSALSKWEKDNLSSNRNNSKVPDIPGKSKYHGKKAKRVPPAVIPRNKSANESYSSIMQHNNAMFDKRPTGATSETFDEESDEEPPPPPILNKEMKSPLMQNPRAQELFELSNPPPTPVRRMKRATANSRETPNGVQDQRSQKAESLNIPPPPPDLDEEKQFPKPPKEIPTIPKLQKDATLNKNSQPKFNTENPGFLTQIRNNKINQMNHVSNKYQMTLRRLNKKLSFAQKKPAIQETLVKKLHDAIAQRRDVIRNDSDDENSEWTI